nr:TPA_asm: hypothetical protein HUJ06_027190 [Nelumbo nucifera]
MWFHSHSTCPLCRAPVQPDIPAPATETPVEVVIPVSEPPETEVESITRLYPGCHHYENETSRTCMSSSSSPLPLPPSAPAESTSLGSRRKPLELAGVSIEVPRRKNEGFRGVDEEVGLGSPTGQGFKSPGSRILSLKRILSRDQRARLSSPAAMMPDCSSTTQIVERFRKILSELGRERKGRDAAENAKSELHTSFNRLKVLANEAIKKRDESERQREEALREKEELLRSNERISGEWRRL